MSEPDDIVREARDLIRSARSLVHELAEEGVDRFDRTRARELEAAVAATAPEPPSATPARRHEPQATPTPRPAEVSPPSQAASDRPSAATPRDPGMPLPSWIAGHGGEKPLSLDLVREELGECQRCGLCAGRREIVFGEGDPNAEIMFIGEGPGEQEDRQGRPFVGRAGELLTQMIEKGMGLSREDVYICNIVKCRPPQNRNPLPPEVTACRPFLEGQIQAVGPKVIVTLGKPAASVLLDRDIAITRMRGTWHDYRGIALMPTLHPSYVLRQYTPENRRAVWDDLKQALARSREAL